MCLSVSLVTFMNTLFVHDLDWHPGACVALIHDVDLVIAAADSEHVANLAPADLPQGNVLVELDLSKSPRTLLSPVVLPNTCRFVLGAACNHFMLEADVVAP